MRIAERVRSGSMWLAVAVLVLLIAVRPRAPVTAPPDPDAEQLEQVRVTGEDSLIEMQELAPEDVSERIAELRRKIEEQKRHAEKLRRRIEHRNRGWSDCYLRRPIPAQCLENPLAKGCV
jgi:hypothetical protein